MGISREDLSVLGRSFSGSLPSLAQATGDAGYEGTHLMVLKKATMSNGRQAPCLV